jgi:hypothetical protein
MIQVFNIPKVRIFYVKSITKPTPSACRPNYPPEWGKLKAGISEK